MQLILLIWLAGCVVAGPHDGSADCSVLREGFTSSEDLYAKLRPGKARAVISWTENGQTGVYIAPVESTWLDFYPYGDWGIHGEIPCDPDLGINMLFDSNPIVDGVLVPPAVGEHPLSTAGLEVPAYEQGGGRPEATVVSGNMIITEFDGVKYSGWMDGEASVQLVSYFDHEPIGVELKVLSFAFKGVLLP